MAQGGIIETQNGDWYAIMFQDHGAVGRIPTLQPMKWVDGWPTTRKISNFFSNYHIPAFSIRSRISKVNRLIISLCLAQLHLRDLLQRLLVKSPAIVAGDGELPDHTDR